MPLSPRPQRLPVKGRRALRAIDNQRHVQDCGAPWRARRRSPPLPERDPPPHNRWQPGEIVDALYLADSDQTAWAEWYRHLAERAIPPLVQMPRALWTREGRRGVADASSPERRSAVSLRPPAPLHSSWPAFQDVGERLAYAGWAGLLALSAARPAG